MQAQAAIIADDLTGANASGALLRARGLRTIVVLDHAHAASFIAEGEALSIDAATRDLPAVASAARVRMVAQRLRAAGVPLIGKRIDSTLRGNVGAEVDAVLGACEARSLALVVAAVPALGRITVGGYLLIDGVPLLETGVLTDPWGAPSSSSVAAVVTAQSRHRTGTITLAEVSDGPEAIESRLRAFLDGGVRIVVCDAATDAHIEGIASAASQLPVVPVDPGPFSAALASLRWGGLCAPVLAVAGSVTRQTHDQLSELAASPGAVLIPIDAAALLGTGADAEINAAAGRLACASNASLLVLSSVHTRAAVLELGTLAGGLSAEEAARRIAIGLGETVARHLDAGHTIAGIYATGGAVTQAVAHRLGATAIEVEREVLPLAVLGRLRGGAYADLPFLSKGGLVGDQHAAVRCVEALRGACLRGVSGVGCRVS
jgi:uncharacterized protein YgbK (DUF1537 family)